MYLHRSCQPEIYVLLSRLALNQAEYRFRETQRSGRFFCNSWPFQRGKVPGSSTKLWVCLKVIWTFPTPLSKPEGKNRKVQNMAVIKPQDTISQNPGRVLGEIEGQGADKGDIINEDRKRGVDWTANPYTFTEVNHCNRGLFSNASQVF